MEMYKKNGLKRPRITDFGLPKQINETSKTSTAFGMPASVEPQFLYRFGVILWEISSGRLPFQIFELKMVKLYIHPYEVNREELIEDMSP
ncbi:hypothetical protein C2G38_2166119 [Gigaspora rosea]|uniref:Protein kinase domain-containing protein n=1 Tax=Gigaspora rosea TaxID=44941 RepID=A0A397W212_9GLOM|nr:hypothetical protein C2G38_2166119 [Gigaspora rosea]